VRLDPAKLSCRIGPVTVFRNGKPVKFDHAAAIREITRPCHDIRIRLGVGRKTDFCYGCDLSKEYVAINAEYHT
jgi:glutamate N-acetyltransferase/amino-acid N-acetyltransferase